MLGCFDHQGVDETEQDVPLQSISDDAGETFTPLAPIVGPFYTFWTALGGAVFQHSSGVCLLSLYGRNLDDPDNNRWGVARSTDNCNTWGPLIDNGHAAGEACFIEFANGTVRAYVRLSPASAGEPIYYSDSADVGLTWSALAPLGWNTIPGPPRVWRTTPSGLITIVYRRVGDGAAMYRLCSDGTGTNFGSPELIEALSQQHAAGSRITTDRDSVGYLVGLENSVTDCKVIFIRTHS